MSGSAPKDAAHLLWLDEALLDELFLDLVERLAAEVAQRKQLFLALLQQLADGLDLVRLEAVERTHRQIELLDRRVPQPALLALLRRPRTRDRVGEVHEQLEGLGEEGSRVAHRLLPRHPAVGPNLDEQAGGCGPLPHSRLPPPVLPPA